MATSTLSRLLLIVCCLSALPAQAEERYFGWYDNAVQSPYPRTRMAEHAHHANTTMAVRWCHPEDWEQARINQLGVILAWPGEFWTGDSTAPALDWGVAIDWNRPMWTDCVRADGSPLRALDWYFTIVAHRDQIVAFGLADEADCNYRTHFPYWTPQSCEAMARKLEWNAGSLKGIFNIHGWDPPVWVNYTSAFVDGLRRGASGYRLPYWVDWFSFDAYAPWGACFGNVSCPQLLAGLKARMRPEQRLVLIPRAFSGNYLNWNPSDIDVAVAGYTYLYYLLTDPQVVGMFPFIEWNVPGVGVGAASVPVIGGSFRVIGQVITGRR